MTDTQNTATIENPIEGVCATYSPEDNKLRLYAQYRLDDEIFQLVKKHGFKWAPKQELFVAPRWTPEREDFCVALAGDIDPEETTLAERAQMKAERLETIADNKAKKSDAYQQTATELSKAFEFGQPILVGHHSERKARKTQERMHNNMSKAVENSRAVSHWLYRASSVEHHANRKNNPAVRARRIKTLLKELREYQSDLNHYCLALNLWQDCETDALILKLANIGRIRTGSILPNDYYEKFAKNEIDLQEMRSERIAAYSRALRVTNRPRFIEHTLNRIAYERALLGQVSRFDGELTPVILQSFAREHGADKPTATKQDSGNFKLVSKAPLPCHLAEGETVKSLELTNYEWCALMQSVGYEVPAKKEGKPPILNFKTDTLFSPNMYHCDEIVPYEQIELTKAEYSKIYPDYRGTRLSVCGTFRFKICANPNWQGAGYMRPQVAVFLTDSKAHPMPESLNKEADEDAA